MTRWTVEIGDEFEAEFDELSEDVRTEVLAPSRVLQQFGPQLGRPRVHTLNGSRHANLKELRFSASRFCLGSETQGHPLGGGR
jgi:hypothetical protein